MSFFPSSVPTALQLLDARNNKSITLTAAINDVVTTIPVNDTSDIPTWGYLTFEDGSNEVIAYTGVTPSTLTGVSRGADGTTASAHGSGGTLGMWGNADYHNILKGEIIAIAQNLSDRIGLSTTQLVIPLGSAAAPSLAFTGILDKGIYSVSTRIGFSTGGVQRCRVGSEGFILDFGQIQTIDGTVGAPAYSFGNSTGTGLYLSGTNRIGIATGGVLKWSITSTGILEANTAAGATISVGNGSAGSPSVTFGTDTDTGIYLNAANQIGFSCAGIIVASMTTAGLNVAGSARVDDGSAGTPTLSFINDTNTGIYRVGADTIGFSTAGVARWYMDGNGTIYPGTSQGIQFPDGSTGTPSHNFANDTDTGMYRSGANQVAFSTAGNINFQIQENGTADDVGYRNTVIYGGANGVKVWDTTYTNAAVSTSAEQILELLEYGCLVQVVGFSSGNMFFDLLVADYAGGATVVSSRTQGSPPARTYSVATSQLKLALASGTYSVSATASQLKNR